MDIESPAGKQALADVLAGWFRQYVSEPVTVVVVPGTCIATLVGTVAFVEGSWRVLVKGQLPLQEFMRVILHEFGHIVHDEAELKRHEVRGIVADVHEFRMVEAMTAGSEFGESVRRDFAAARNDRAYMAKERSADRWGHALGKTMKAEIEGG